MQIEVFNKRKSPYSYELPRTNKRNTPLCSIIYQCCRFTYKLSIIFPCRFFFILKKKFTDFINKINDLNLSSGKMVSFDVYSLFTKVSIDDILEFLSH